MAQLDTIYGQNERKVIFDTCAYKAVLGVTDTDSQEYFSKLIGTYDKLVTSHGTNREAFTGINRGNSTNVQELEKRIILPHEFGMQSDIVLLTPFPMPLKPPQSGRKKPLFFMTINEVREHYGRGNQACVPFCRVGKVPYYGENE